MDEIRQLYKARAALEGICAAEFTRKATAEQRAELTRITEELDRIVELGTPETFGGLNAQWHALIMDGSGNPIIRSLVERLNTPIYHLLFRYLLRRRTDSVRRRQTTGRSCECILTVIPRVPRPPWAGMSRTDTDPVHARQALHFDSRGS